MRFLLNSAVKAGKQSQMGITRSPRSANSVKVSNAVSSNDLGVHHVKSWGQQCSPDCGCVIRFETSVDPSTRTIVKSTYHAKSIVAVQKNGYLEPLRTTRTGKPMIKECKCKTAHDLARDVTTFIVNKPIDQIRNMSEFSFTRSSPAFRHAVLVDRQLPRADTHCFDLVEEAYTAMIKGFLPRQRRNKHSFDKLLADHIVWNSPGADEDEILVPRTRETGIDQTSISMSSPRSLSTLSMLDINANHWEHEGHMQEEEKQKRGRMLDWLTFVDEQNRDEESA